VSAGIRAVSSRDLGALAESIASGRLSPPFNEASVGRYCAKLEAAAVAAQLQGILETGASAQSVSEFLTLLAADRADRPILEDVLDLVLTGPEAPGAANRDTAVVVRELFANAEHSVLVVGYAVYQGKEVFEALARRMDEVPDLNVRLFLNISRAHRDTTGSSQLIAQFVQRFKSQQWPGEKLPEVYYDPRSLELEQKKKASLHAKCVVVDKKKTFISSANFTEAAQERNVEVGLLIESESLSKQVAWHFEALAADGGLVRVPGL